VLQERMNMPDTPVEAHHGGPYDPRMEARVSRLEEDTREEKAARQRLEAAFIRIEATLPHLATKADLAELRTDLADVNIDLKSDIARLDVKLADKPSRTYIWAYRRCC
jgi:hypothetical protein